MAALDAAVRRADGLTLVVSTRRKWSNPGAKEQRAWWVASAVRCRGVRSSTDQLGGWGLRGEGAGGGVQKKRQEQGEAAGKPVTIVLLDDRKQDAYGNCQVATPPPPAAARNKCLQGDGRRHSLVCSLVC